MELEGVTGVISGEAKGHEQYPIPTPPSCQNRAFRTLICYSSERYAEIRAERLIVSGWGNLALTGFPQTINDPH